MESGVNTGLFIVGEDVYKNTYLGLNNDGALSAVGFSDRIGVTLVDLKFNDVVMLDHNYIFLKVGMVAI